MSRDERFCFARPISRNLPMVQRATGDCFGLSDRIFEHRCLPGSESRRKTRIAIRVRIVPDPKIDSAVRGKSNRIFGDAIIVDPARRSSERESGEDENSFWKQTMQSLVFDCAHEKS